MSENVSMAFVCVQNAGRSQMATAFAEREKESRNSSVTILTGGTDPADHVHPEVVEIMQEKGIELSNRIPRSIGPNDLEGVDYVITMGCGAEEVCPVTWSGEARDWDLDDPDGRDLDEVRRIRDEIQRRVQSLFDELDG